MILKRAIVLGGFEPVVRLAQSPQIPVRLAVLDALNKITRSGGRQTCLDSCQSADTRL
jgi:hypothetical protein